MRKFIKQYFCKHKETAFIKLHRKEKKVEYKCKNCDKILIVDWVQGLQGTIVETNPWTVIH